MNETLFIIVMIVNFGLTLLSYKLFKKTGLFMWIAMTTVLCNIEALKCVDMFGMAVTLGNVAYVSMCLATDILNEEYGLKVAKKGIWIGFFSVISFTVLTQISLNFIPNAADFANDSLKLILGVIPRLVIASMITYLVSSYVDVYLYKVIRKYVKSVNGVWIRSNATTLVSQLVDSFLFTILAFGGMFGWGLIVELSLTTYAIKVIASICNTPFMYIAKRIRKSFKGNEELE